MLYSGLLKSLIFLGVTVSSVGTFIYYFSDQDMVMDKETSLAFSFPEVSSSYKDINPKVNSDSNLFLAYLENKLKSVLDVSSNFGWVEILSVNKKPYSKSNIEKLKASCKKIYNLPLSSLSEQEKKKYLDYARLNCQLPKTSGVKFQENGLNYLEKSKNVEFDESIINNTNFWSKVQNYINLKEMNIRSNEDKFKFYCERFPNFMTVEQGYTSEERDYLRFCLKNQ